MKPIPIKHKSEINLSPSDTVTFSTEEKGILQVTFNISNDKPVLDCVFTFDDMQDSTHKIMLNTSLIYSMCPFCNIYKLYKSKYSFDHILKCASLELIGVE